MISVLLACALLVVLTTVIHYEALVLMSSALPGLRITPRAKLLLVMLGAFVAHAVEIGIYGLAATWFRRDRCGCCQASRHSTDCC